jgi:hypothetical protein
MAKKSKEILEVAVVPDDWSYTKEEEIRLETMKAAGNILYAGRISPPSTYEIFELLHYLDHWVTSGALPQDPKARLTLVGGTDAKPIK